MIVTHRDHSRSISELAAELFSPDAVMEDVLGPRRDTVRNACEPAGQARHGGDVAREWRMQMLDSFDAHLTRQQYGLVYVACLFVLACLQFRPQSGQDRARLAQRPPEIRHRQSCGS